MLAGHTHGAQFGLTILGRTYSPAQWIYEEWAGLYQKDGHRFTLIGVQNWGTRFQQYGNLAKAVAGTDASSFRLLMSHDPTHWDAQVRATGIDLMLAGHTHGAQFGLTILGRTYSPAQWIYEEWAGLYQKDGLQLYVNRGFGFLGFLGRVGMPPEITVLELHSA
ncbi:MAG: hypothetical protein ABI373_01840, partial [Flavobacteriales bacterium]